MNDPYMQHMNPTNPLNINIEFNIHPRKHLETAFKSNRYDPDQIYNKNMVNHFPPSRTPELAQTDRNPYLKDIDALAFTEAIKKKRSKRNSMDINLIPRPVQGDQTHKKKGQKVLMQTQLFKKVESKKKRTLSKYEVDIFRKTLGEGASKSAAIESKTDRKTFFNPSLKNIIHKIVNSELSKRSLGTSFSKGKSPYHINSHTQSLGSATARKKQKKKSMSFKSERQIKHQDNNEQSIIVEKLNSLKSMTNSILKSEADEPQMPYYSKKRGPIRIKTDQSIDLLDEITYYQKRTRRDEKRKQAINQMAVKETTQLIETYIQMMASESQGERKQSLDQLEQEFEMSVPVEQERHERYKMRKIISNEMHNLFDDQLIKSSEQNKRQSYEEISAKKEEKKQNDTQQEKMRPFLSSEIARGGLTGQLERLRLQQLKKQEIEKWGYLLQFIKKNMRSEQTDTQSVLNQVYSYLQRSKNDLQKDLAHQKRHQKQDSKQLDCEFTVKYSQNMQEVNEEYYQESNNKQQEQQEEQEDQDVASFRQDYNNTEENQNLKLLNLETISTALKQRKKSLLAKKEKELSALQQQRDCSRITEAQYQKQKERIEKWIKKQLEEIAKANNNIWKGYREAKGVLDKTIASKRYEQQTATGKMMKCLSETYLRKPTIDYVQALKPQQKQKSRQSIQSSSVNAQSVSLHSSQPLSQTQQHQDSQTNELVVRSIDVKSNEDEDNLQYEQDFEDIEKSEQELSPSPMSEPLGGSQELTLQKSEEMQAIKERLLRMKEQHFLGQQDLGQNVNYEQVQRSLDQNYQEEQMAILNREINNTANNYNKLDTKLKYCCAEDKEDIFQFIFLDLCIELYQQPCKDNRIMKSINNHVAKAQAQANKKKGVKTNLNVVKEYLKRLTSFLLRTNKTTLNNLNKPMGPTAIQMLRYMHDGDYDIKEDDEEVPTLIIPINAFQKFQQSLLPTLEFQQYYDDTEKEEARVNFLKTILHIHNKALFDSLNEFLDHQRPFSIWGAPFPWKKASTFHRKFSAEQQQEKLKKSSDKVIEQCSYVCGLLVDKQESLVGNSKISDSYIQQIREDRLSRMLANELVQSEQRWLFYDDEQTEVLVQLGNFVWNSLLAEVRSQLTLLCKQ